MERKKFMKELNKISAGIIGGSGFVGEELLGLVSRHPNINLLGISSRELVGREINSVFPHFSKKFDLKFCYPDDKLFNSCDVLFLATPHGTSMSLAGEFLKKKVRIIDLSADFRISDPEIWSKWYGTEHTNKDLIAESVYGLTELNYKSIKRSNLVSVPGCYPTASLLGLLPLLKVSTKIESIIIDAKSGISGAGRSTVENGLSEDIKNNFKAYSVEGHRHYPEINQQITSIYGSEVELNLLTQLIPIFRGLYVTMYIKFSDNISDHLEETYKSFSESSIHIEFLNNKIPNLSDVINTNKCHISLHNSSIDNQLVVISCIDNLLKGAAGQAIECFNLMFNFDVGLGLN